MTDTDDRWDRRKILFEDARSHPPERRRARLEVAAGGDEALVQEVLRLLEHHDAVERQDDHGAGALRADDLHSTDRLRLRDPLSGDLGRLAAPLLSGAPLAVDPSEFHPYVLHGVIGEGGMGVVFLAERPELEMRVAIKVLRDAWLSPARRRRFLAEERTLAQLSHTGIARILDARVLSDGTPWFALEYVDGVPITEHCAGRAVPLAERLHLLQQVCEAVAHAHARQVVHRDLKPSNILVTTAGEVRLLDFGIAKRLTTALEGDGSERTTVTLLTPAYAAPEQLRGGPVTVRTDVFALGLIVHEVVLGTRPGGEGARPAASVAQAAARLAEDVSVPGGGRRALRAIETITRRATEQDPTLRYADVESLAADLARVRDGQPIGAGHVHGRWAHTLRRHAARVVGVVALLAAGAFAASRVAGKRPASVAASPTVVAVFPLRNQVDDSATNHLRLAIAEEVANRLSELRGLVVRDFSRTQNLRVDTLDVGDAASRLGVTHVLTGEYATADDEIEVQLQLVDVARDSVVWRDAVRARAGSALDLQGQLAVMAHGGIPLALGLSRSRPDIWASRPRSERAYELYLRSAAARYDPGPGNAEGIALLEEALRLDSTFAPAWALLSRRYYVASRFDTGDSTLPDRILEASRRAVALDPGSVVAGARLAIAHIERGETADAYRQLHELLRRRADSPDVHFVLSYVLRFAGLLRESARECGMAMTLDPHNYGWRSCAVPHLLMGDNASARGFVSLDAGSEWAKAMEVHMLVRSGQPGAATAAPRPNIPQWKSYDLLLACASGAGAAVRDSLAALVSVSDDPESNFFAATHLSYCGQVERAVALLDRAISRGYCSYPVMETDPLLAPLRATPAFASLRTRGANCQARFVADVSRREVGAR